MSQLKVDDIVDSAGTGAPTFSRGAQIFVPKATGADADTVLTTSDSRLQVISAVTAVRTYTLPSTGIKAGDRWTFVCNATAANGTYVLIDAADSSVVGVCHTGGNVTEVMALSNDPATQSDWLVLKMKEYVCNSSTTDGSDTTSFVYGPLGGLIPTITATTTGSTWSKRTRFLKGCSQQDSVFYELYDNTSPFGWVAHHSTVGYSNIIPMTEYYGFGFGVWVSDVDMDTYFGRGGCRIPVSASGVGASFPNSAGDRWRIVKVTGV